MLYAALKLLHLLALVVWIGGMFFTLACLRPALAVLDAPARPRLMHAVLARFLPIVNAAIGLILLSGLAMLFSAWRAAADAGAAFRLPLSWIVMIVLGVTMMGIFEYLRGRLYRRFQAALQAQDGPSIAALLALIRRAVTVNLGLGLVIIVAMKLGVPA